MTMKTYHGSCHCGDVRYSAAFDLSQGTAKCNCTLCRKAGVWHVVMKPEDFALLTDPGLTHEYPWVTAELIAAPIELQDGLHVRWGRAPENTRML